MSALLYHGFGLVGYEYVCTQYAGGAVIFSIKRHRGKFRCSYCGGVLYDRLLRLSHARRLPGDLRGKGAMCWQAPDGLGFVGLGRRRLLVPITADKKGNMPGQLLCLLPSPLLARRSPGSKANSASQEKKERFLIFPCYPEKRRCDLT